jgi:hypothetical protein
MSLIVSSSPMPADPSRAVFSLDCSHLTSTRSLLPLSREQRAAGAHGRRLGLAP